MPASPDARTVMGTPLGAIGLTPFSRHNLAGREHTLVKAMRTSGVRVIVIDELHNMLAAHGRQQHQLLNLLRWPGNELQIPLVCIGTRDACLALRTDDRLENRFEPFVPPPWSHGSELSALLASFEQALQLERSSLTRSQMPRISRKPAAETPIATRSETFRHRPTTASRAMASPRRSFGYLPGADGAGRSETIATRGDGPASAAGLRMHGW